MATSMVSMCMYSVTHSISVAMVSHNSGQVATGRNALVRRALEFNADWLLFVDSDMTFPPNALQKLLSHGRDAVGVVCHKKAPPFDRVGILKNSQDSKGLAEAEALGCGVMLFKMDLFRRVEAPWFVHTWGDAASRSPSNPDGEIGEDIGFMRRLRSLGVQLWADLDLSPQIGHIGETVVTAETAGASAPRILDIGQMPNFRRVG